MIYAGKQLEDSNSLAFYSVTAESTLFEVLRLPGGMPFTYWQCRRSGERMYSSALIGLGCCRRCYSNILDADSDDDEETVRPDGDQ